MASKIYTKTGDSGETSLVGGKRISKADDRLEAYGTIDELNSFLGALYYMINDDIEDSQELTNDQRLIIYIQNQLFVVGANLATDPEATEYKDASILKPEAVTVLEQRIDKLSDILPPLKQFVLPSGAIAACQANICRAICRRAERAIHVVAQESQVDDTIFQFVNRLSDYLFLLSRLINIETGYEERVWDQQITVTFKDLA